jgi:hypothetical protein
MPWATPLIGCLGAASILALGRYLRGHVATAEELPFRLTLARGLSPVAGATGIAIVSAILLGVPHWFGNPGRLIRVAWPTAT